MNKRESSKMLIKKNSMVVDGRRFSSLSVEEDDLRKI